MKTAIYVENGITQLVLTPENPWEEDITAKIGGLKSQTSVKIFRGSFYNCQGGWIRQGTTENSSLIVILTEPTS